MYRVAGLSFGVGPVGDTGTGIACNSLFGFTFGLDHQDVPKQSLQLFEVKIDNSSVEVDMDARMGQACHFVAVLNDDFSPKFTIKALSGSNLQHDFCLLGDSAAIAGVSRPSIGEGHQRRT